MDTAVSVCRSCNATVAIIIKAIYTYRWPHVQDSTQQDQGPFLRSGPWSSSLLLLTFSLFHPPVVCSLALGLKIARNILRNGSRFLRICAKWLEECKWRTRACRVCHTTPSTLIASLDKRWTSSSSAPRTRERNTSRCVQHPDYQTHKCPPRGPS